jgi:hypothetical protein
MSDIFRLRGASTAVFGNEKLAEVITFIATQGLPVTAQMVSTGTQVNYSLVRDALRRLTAAGVLVCLPRTGGSRSQLFYQVIEGRLWSLLRQVAEELHRQAFASDAPGAPLITARSTTNPTLPGGQWTSVTGAAATDEAAKKQQQNAIQVSFDDTP